MVRLAGPPVIDLDKGQYIVQLKAWPDPPPFRDRDGRWTTPTFAPGTYAGFLHLDAPWLQRVATPVAVSRSENRWQRVGVLAAVGGLAGFLGFAVLHWFAGSPLLVTHTRFVVAALMSVGVGAYVGYTTSYLSQSVWTFGANGKQLFLAAVTAATTGPLVTGLLTKVYDDARGTQRGATSEPAGEEDVLGDDEGGEDDVW